MNERDETLKGLFQRLVDEKLTVEQGLALAYEAGEKTERERVRPTPPEKKA